MDNFDRQLLKAMPWLPGLFSKMLKRLERFNGREPVTLLAEIEKDVGKIVQRVSRNPSFMAKAMTAVLKHKYFGPRLIEAMQTCIRIVEEQTVADPRAAQLMRLIEEADSRVPYVSSLVLADHADLRNQFRPMCMAGTLLEEARKTTGEARATLLIDALGKMAELLYQPYLLALWKLTCLANNKWPTEPDFGALVIELSKRLAEYPGLVDPDALWMRNAARHERWRPLPAEDSIIMWDKKTPPTQFSLDELAAKVEAMYQMAAVTFGAVARCYLFRNMLTDTGIWALIGTVLPKALEAAGGDLSRVDAMVDREMQSELQPLRDRFAPLNAFMLAKCPEAQRNPAAAEGSV